MKPLLFLFAIIFFPACFTMNQAEKSSCEVLLDEIAESYTGNCRRGLAHGYGQAEGEDSYKGRFRRGLPHGLGEYIWANGNQYLGLWNKGKMHGEGTFYYAQLDTVYTGRWNNGQFLDDKHPRPKAPYTVRYKRNITRYRFIRVIDGNRVFFKIQDSNEARRISQISTHGSSGQYYVHSNMFGYEEVEFPFTGKISFVGPSRTGVTQYLIEMMFEINEPGYWEILIYY